MHNNVYKWILYEKLIHIIIKNKNFYLKHKNNNFKKEAFLYKN